MSPQPMRDSLAPYFADFDGTLDSSHVSAALDLLQAASGEATAGEIGSTLDGWLSFLTELDRRIDRAWNAQEAPAQGVAPPPGHGPVRPSGDVDPETIADPDERASYVAALEVARTAVAHHQAQAALRQIGQQALPLFADFLDSRHARPELDRWLVASGPEAAWLSSAARGEAPPGWWGSLDDRDLKPGETNRP